MVMLEMVEVAGIEPAKIKVSIEFIDYIEAKQKQTPSCSHDSTTYFNKSLQC